MSSRAAARAEYERIQFAAAEGDPFMVLDVNITASDSEVKSAYKQLAMRFHVGCLSSVELASILAKLLRQPDRLRFEPNCSQAEKDERKAQATEAFKRVSEAFVNLSNRMSRFLILTAALREEIEMKVRSRPPPASSAFSSKPSPRSNPSSKPPSPRTNPFGSSSASSAPHSKPRESSSYSHTPRHTSRESLFPDMPVRSSAGQPPAASKRSPVNRISPRYEQRNPLDAPASYGSQSQIDRYEPRYRQQQTQSLPLAGAAPGGGALTKDPFAMFDEIFGGSGSFFGNSNNSGSTADSFFGSPNALMSGNSDPFALFDAMVAGPDTTAAAHDFTQQHASSPSAASSNGRTPARRDNGNPFVQQPAQPQQPQARSQQQLMSMGSSGRSGSGDPFSDMFSQLSMGMGGFDDMMSGDNPDRRGGIMSQRSSNRHMDRNGNLRQGRQERSMGMFDMGMNGRMMMESSFNVQTFQGGGNRMSSQPQSSPFTSGGSRYESAPGNTSAFGGMSSPPSSNGFSSSSPFGSASPSDPGLKRRSSNTFNPGSAIGRRNTFRMPQPIY